jgi:hypothetical protein
MVLGLVILLISLLAGTTPGQEIFQFQANNIKMEILPAALFEARFGDNPDVPRTDAAIIALAEKLYPPVRKRKPDATPAVVQECREYEVGVLFGALQNPAISDQTRRQVDYILEAAAPPLPQTYTSGHFKFNYTDSDPDPDHNVTLAEIQATATRLNSYWNTYAANFKTPKNYISGGTEMVDVNVYYLGARLYGETGSKINYINLNSKLCVKDACKRRTTSAHELFHRVQYAYGYISGTARMQWIVEGTASWSQKYTNQTIRDYMERMNEGLDKPEYNLINTRSYNACHFWVYLQKLVGSWTAIRDVWATFETNGNNAKAAVDTVATSELGKNFDQFAQAWVKTNYIKDLDNAATGNYDYDEDEVTQTSCGVTYGPLNAVPRVTNAIADNATYFNLDGSVSAYGADYYDFPLGAGLTQLQVKVEGAAPGNFSYHFIGVKSNRWRSIINKTSATSTYTKTLTAGQWDKLALVVAGRSRGGDYTITVGTPCITGTWLDSYGIFWTLQHDTTTNAITGKVQARCGNGGYDVTGSYVEPNITLISVRSDLTANCCSLRFEGTVSDCATASGTWTQFGTDQCAGTGSLSMTKQEAAGAPYMEVLEGPTPDRCKKCN